ncbi:glycosyltransferase [Xylanimonas protaetiae]|uniref:Glycosyltransferase family 1 protein n=1 Tax=Xylanimonas protaetiae TaxID=2509457 RepID=A0A4P6F5D6_9MICO|nr:glycosyltransferase [Xylanimonas protaetiae]QAY71170.1 glycosyltransferase family 1 protein [Xylanimonas protaetiae]
MRIALVSEHASPLAVVGGAEAGGQNVHVAALASALADGGHTVEVYTRRDDTALPERVPLRAGVDVVHVPAGPPVTVPRDELLPYMDALGDWLADRWRPDPPDVAHAHFWMSALATLRAARSLPGRPRLGRTPVVVTYHALGSVKRRHQREQDTSPRGRVAAEADIGRTADCVVATCGDEVRELEELGVPASQVHVVPCGVDAGLFRPGAMSPRVPPRAQEHRLVSLGRLVERKGVDLAIRAVRDLPGTELLVAGGPPPEGLGADPDVARLRRLAGELGVADRVRFLGRVAREDVPGLLCSADVVVAAPWYEPFGIVPVEAAACGVPVVGAAVGGLLDTVLDGVTGRLVPPRDHAALTTAVSDLLARPDVGAAYGAAARRRALDRYTWARVGMATAAVYQRQADAARLSQEVAS